MPVFRLDPLDPRADINDRRPTPKQILERTEIRIDSITFLPFDEVAAIAKKHDIPMPTTETEQI